MSRFAEIWDAALVAENGLSIEPDPSHPEPIKNLTYLRHMLYRWRITQRKRNVELTSNPFATTEYDGLAIMLHHEPKPHLYISGSLNSVGVISEGKLGDSTSTGETNND